MTTESDLAETFKRWFRTEHPAVYLDIIEAAGFEIVPKESSRDIDREPVLTSTKP